MAAIRLNPAERTAAGERMRAAREVAGLSLARVAEVTGVSVNAVAQWEHGATPNDDLRPVIAELYGLDEDVLFAEYEARMTANRTLLGLT